MDNQRISICKAKQKPFVIGVNSICFVNENCKYAHLLFV